MPVNPIQTNQGRWVEVQRTSNDLPSPSTWAQSMVFDRFQTTLEKAQEMLDLLVGPNGDGGYLGELNNAIQAAPPVSVTAPDVDTDLTLKQPKGEAPDPFDTSTLSDYPDETYPAPTLAQFPDDPNHPEPDLRNLPTVDTSGLRNLPDAPDEPQDMGTLTWSGQPFTSDLYPTIVARLLRDLRDGATGLPEDVEQAIYRRARTRQLEERVKLHDDMVNQAANMQFQYPSGVLASALNGYAVAANRMDADIEDKIITQQAELAQKNSQFVIEQSIKLEEILRKTWNDEESRRLDFEKSKIDLLVRAYAERVRVWTARIEGVKAYVQAQTDYLRATVEANRGVVEVFKALYDVYKTKVDAVVSQNQSEVDVYKTRYEALNTRIQAAASRNKGLTDVYTAMIQAYGEEAKAVGTENQSMVQWLEAKVKAADLKLRAAIASAEQALSGYSTEMSLKERTLSSMAGIAAQAVASWAGAVNASASTSLSGSESKSESWSHSESLTESHSYEEDPPERSAWGNSGYR